MFIVPLSTDKLMQPHLSTVVQETTQKTLLPKLLIVLFVKRTQRVPFHCQKVGEFFIAREVFFRNVCKGCVFSGLNL